MRRLILTSWVLLGILLAVLAFFLLVKLSNFWYYTPRLKVTIPEGATVAEINQLLTEKGVLAGESLPPELEGFLFPDTYEFFLPSSAQTVELKFLDNFNRKARSLLPPDIGEEALGQVIIKASLVEKEAPNSADRRIIAGIIEKRLAKNMPLQIDASLCYAKQQSTCWPITDEDKKFDSPYNTYLYRGLPPGPIANPGEDAILAVLNPQPSPYWFYLSDPQSKKTIFAKTLDEHNKNIFQYLKK